MKNPIKADRFPFGRNAAATRRTTIRGEKGPLDPTRSNVAHSLSKDDCTNSSSTRRRLSAIECTPIDVQRDIRGWVGCSSEGRQDARNSRAYRCPLGPRTRRIFFGGCAHGEIDRLRHNLALTWPSLTFAPTPSDLRPPPSSPRLIVCVRESVCNGARAAVLPNCVPSDGVELRALAGGE